MRHVFLIASLAALGCTPAGSGRADSSARTDSVASADSARAASPIHVDIRVTPTSLKAGDSATVRVIATNHGADLVEIIAGCGPGLDFEVRGPAGDVRYPAREVAWNCPIFDSNRLDPAETDTVDFRWGSATPGRFMIRGGLRAASGLPAASPAITLDVR